MLAATRAQHIATARPTLALGAAQVSSRRAAHVLAIQGAYAWVPAALAASKRCSSASSSRSVPVLGGALPKRALPLTATRGLATVAEDGGASPASSAGTPDMATSLDAIVPDVLFTEREVAEKHNIPRETGRKIVELVLTQLRCGVDAKTVEQAKALETDTDKQARAMMQEQGLPAESLSHFALSLMSASRDPRRTPISFRLMAVAFGVDPESLPDPTAKSSRTPEGLDESLASQPIAGEGAWGVNAAGYNWASMILSGQAPPPAGLHVLPKGQSEALEAIKDQQAAAVRIYATLAMRGDAQGMVGMGRILMAGTQRHAANATGDDAATQEAQTKMMRDRAVALWTKAGQKGIGEAWFELGLLTLGPGGSEADEGKARGYFDLGAKAGDARSHHALGVLLTQDAMKDNRTSPPPERTDKLQKSLEHFKTAAELGDGQSAHHMGLRYLLRDEMVQEVGLGSDKDGRTQEQVKEAAAGRHQSMWNVMPNDAEALKWFEMAADEGFVPSMLNVAGFLVEGRGMELPKKDAEVTPDFLTKRMVDLKRAETLYAKVAAHTSAVMQQTGGGEAAKANPELGANEQMAQFAQQALGQVQQAIQQTAELSKSLGSQKPQPEAP